MPTRDEVGRWGSFLRILVVRNSASEPVGSGFRCWKVLQARRLAQPTWVMLRRRQQSKLGGWKERERRSKKEKEKNEKVVLHMLGGGKRVVASPPVSCSF